jgi:hypothetical protein
LAKRLHQGAVIELADDRGWICCSANQRCKRLRTTVSAPGINSGAP